MADFETVQDALLTRLRTSQIPNVFETSVPPGYLLPKQNGVHLPYALITFGGKSPMANRYKNLQSTKLDAKWTSVAVECVGDSQRDCRTVSKIVRNLFEGYTPDVTWGELEEQLSGDYTVKVPEYELWPVRYATGIVFNTVVDTVS